MAGLYAPLPTLRSHPRGGRRTDRGDVGCYSFIAVDSHHILLAGLPAHSLALRPAHSRSHQIRDPLIEGFSHFVTSMPAPVASGWSGRRVGLAPTGKRRLVTAHVACRSTIGRKTPRRTR